MENVLDIAAPTTDEEQQTPPQGGQPPPAKIVLSDQNRQRLDSIVSKMLGNREKDEDIQAVVDDFKKKYGTPQAGQQAPVGSPKVEPKANVPPALPEHHVSHTQVQDARHLNDLANQPIRQEVVDPQGGLTEGNVEDIKRNKTYRDQYEKAVGDLATGWGTDAEATKRAIEDFSTESNEDQLKRYAGLAKDNPAYYGRLKNANDLRMAVAGSGNPSATNDANALNTLFSPQQSDTYDRLQDNIAMAQEILTKHGVYSQNSEEKLKSVYSPLINTLQPGLLLDYFNSDYHKAGLSESQYAGLETEKFFQPEKYKRDIAIIRQNRGLDQAGGGEVTPPGKEGYAYDRGVENVLFQLEAQGRQNTGEYIGQRTKELEPQIQALRDRYQQQIHDTADPLLQQQLQKEFYAYPLMLEAAKLEEGQTRIEEARTQDQRRFPLNYGDRATRLVKDAMSTTNGWAGVGGNQVLLGAGESADNTARFIKNVYINLLGSEQAQARNAASNMGHQALTELAGYEGSEYSLQEQPLLVAPELVKKIQGVFNDGSLTTEQKNQRATDLVRENEGQITVNPKAGQQNLTGKAILYSASNTIGQILGIADQSLLMGGLLGDAAKAQQMANAFVPMYASTQNQLYEQALARGDEKPLLKSHLDAAIVSLASLINPDIKVVKGMVGAETGIGKLIAGVDEATWNKVLSTNRPLVYRMIAGTKATARQLALANLQYGLIVPSAQYLVHKNVFNEDPNLGDAIKDGLLQTSITMALPALLHGAWGGVNATTVNPMQKLALVEAGLHPKENIELIEQQVQKGQIVPDRADQIKEVIRETGKILEHLPGVKSDGTPMTEKEVVDASYQLLRKKILEGQLKNAPDPNKPALEQQIHAINQDIAELHTSDAQRHKTELNDLLRNNLERIRDNDPAMEAKVREAIARNEPESIFKDIHDQAREIKTVEGKEESQRSEVEGIYGKKLVNKAFELQSKPKVEVKPAEQLGPESPKNPSEGVASETTSMPAPATPSFLQSRHADTIHDEQGRVSGPNNKELSAQGKRDANDLARDLEGKGVTTIITSGLERSKETGQAVADKVEAKVESRPELNTWDIKDFDGLSDKKFKDVQQWFVENPDAVDYQGPLEKYRGKDVGESINDYAGRILPAMERIEKENGPETLLVNHSNNMMLWEAYLKNGREWNEQTRRDYLDAEKPEPATLTNKTNNNAIPIGSPATMGAYASGDQGPGGTGEGQGMGPGQQGQAPAGETAGKGEGQGLGEAPPGGAGGPPLSPDNPFREPLEDIPNGIKKAISMSIRAELNLPEIALPKLGADTEVLRRGKTAVDSGQINPREVARRVTETQGIYTPNEGAAMLYYGHQLRQAEASLREEKQEADDILKTDPGNTAAFYAKVTAEQRLGQLDDEVELKTRADRLNSRAWGNLGNVMQIETDETFSPTNIRTIIKDNYGGKIPEEVQARLDKALAERDEAIAEMKKARDKVALMELQKDAQKDEGKEKPNVKKSVAATIREKKAALKKEREGLIEDLKQAIKKDSGTLGANPLPIHTVEAISKLALNYFKDGVLSVEGITNKIYEDIKDVVEGIDKNQIREAVASYRPLARSQQTEKALKKAANLEVDILRLEERRKKNPDAQLEIEPKRAPLNFEQDTEYVKANQRRINAEFRIKQEKMKSYASQESRLQKILGWANRLMRISILSGVKVLEKLAAAATIGSAAQKPIEEVLNGIWGKAFPKIAEKADVDMGLNLLAVGRYYSEFFNPLKFARDTKDIVAHGETMLGKELEKQHFDHIPVLDLPTDLHQVIKAPAKRATFEYALTKILADQQAKGIDISHPLVMESARQRAFARAKYEIFMEDNQVSKKFGKWEAEWKDQGKTGAAKSFLLHFIFPVSKVPTNIARRVGLSITGLPTGLYKATQAYRGGIENLSTEEANAIGRSLTKGTIGTALWMAGFFGYKSLGGLYSKFDPNKQRKDEPLADEMKLIGQPVSKPWQHALPLEVMQMGATFRHIYEKTKTTSKSDPIAVAEATMGSTGAILEQIPVVETPVNLLEATKDPYMAKKLGADLKRRFEPQLLFDLGILQKEEKKPPGRTGRTARGRAQ